jgi:Tfp pilus assembly protein PilO
LLAFAFIAIALVLYINFIKPTYANIKADQGRLAALIKRNSEHADIFGKLKDVSGELRKSPDLQNRASMALPLSANTADSLNQIVSIASANGLSITSVDVVEAPVVPAPIGKSDTSSIMKGTGVLKNNIRVTGSYAQIKAFLQGVESGVRISSIRSFKIDRALNVTNPDSFNGMLEIETYYQTS